MIYWVSGFQRSGTSMMMACLIAGGMDALFDPDLDRIIHDLEKADGYRLNPSLYETDPAEFQKPDFRKRAEGKLVKGMAPGILAHVQKGDRMVFMRRDFEEIRSSHEHAMLGTIMYTPDQFAEMMDKTYKALKKKCDVIRYDYRRVVDAPGFAFRALKMLGWPVDPVKAEAVVDPSLYRFRMN